MIQRNPFRWKNDGRKSHIQVAFLWRWQEHGCLRNRRVWVRLDHVLAKNAYLYPDCLSIADQELWRRLVEASENEKLA